MEPDTETLDICLPYALHVVYGGSDFRPEWRTEVVVGLATGIMEDSAYERLPILADALEEAGCTDETLLRHCRDPIQHHDQCWALGLALNRYIPPEPEPPPPPVVEPPRVAPLTDQRPTSTADDGTRYLGCVAFVLLLAVKGFLSPGGSSSPPTYNPDVPRPFVPVVAPAPAEPKSWSRPSDRRLQELLGTNNGPIAPPAAPPSSIPWLRPSAPVGEVPPGSR